MNGRLSTIRFGIRFDKETLWTEFRRSEICQQTGKTDLLQFREDT